MNLLDHFHPPLKGVRHWEAFHAQWAGSIASVLNQGVLPEGYFAEPQVHIGSRIEVDIGTFESEDSTFQRSTEAVESSRGTATLPVKVWTPTAPEFVMPAVFPDSAEILVYNNEAGPTVVAAVELVSPGNKDRDDFRRAFAAKCASLLQQGIGLVIVDIVTDRTANLHNTLIGFLEAGDQFLLAPDVLFATSYRPRRLRAADQIEVWAAMLAVGQPLPIVPLPLDKGLILPLNLGSAYTEACERSRIS